MMITKIVREKNNLLYEVKILGGYYNGYENCKRT